MRSRLAMLLMCGIVVFFACNNLCVAAGLSDGGDFQLYKNPPPANDFQLAMADGNTVNLSEFKGKVVLLNFWRKDCQYCDTEKGYLKHLQNALNTQDMKVVCVNFWDNPAWVKTFAKNNGDTLTIAAKPDGKKGVVENIIKGRVMGYFVLNDANEAIYEVKGFPSTYVINKEGQVVASHLGMVKWAVPGVKDWLAGLIGSPAAASGSTSGSEWLDNLMNGFPKTTRN